MESAGERVLVNFFYAQPVGHAVEALHYCHGHHAAAPGRQVSVALNASTATELARFCPFVERAYAIDHPFLAPCADSDARLAALPRHFDWVLDDGRRHQPFQLEAFPGMRDYYAASDRRLVAARRRTFAGNPEAGYVPHRQLRLELPAAARRAAARRLGDPGVPRIAVMPAGSGERALYPSAGSWTCVLDALAEARPGVRFVLVGRLTAGDDRRTATSLSAGDLEALLAHPTRPADAFGLPLAEQLAIVEACDVFLAPHTGFGLAALAVATPWLALSGGRWFEYFFNRVPFRSVIPDAGRYPCFTQFAPADVRPDGDDGPRTPSMSRARIREDLPRLVTAAGELIDGSLTYDHALRDYFAALLAAHSGDDSAIWSIDGVHRDYIGGGG